MVKESLVCVVLGWVFMFCQLIWLCVVIGKSELCFFCCFCCFNDYCESVSFQGGVVNQCVVDVWLGEQFCGVVSVNGIVVLDDYLFSDFGVSFSNVVMDEFVYCLCLSWGC